MATNYADDSTARGLTDDEKLLARAKACYKQGTAAYKNQAEREKKATAFYYDDQWDPGVKRLREGTGGATDGVGSLPPLPPRPTITINKIKDPVRQVVNQERDAELGVEIVAADDFEDISPPIDDTEIKLREGLVRRIQRESDAASARSWAFQRATIAGIGWYRILTRYVPGKTFAKEVYVADIYDQREIIADPSHVKRDGSDSEWTILGASVPWEQYKSEFPGTEDDPNQLLDYSDEDFRSLADAEPDWFQVDDKNLRMCRVVEFFYTTRTSVTLCELDNGDVVEEKDVPEGVNIPEARKRVEVTKQIKWVKLDGKQILDRTDWEGPDMPFVKVVCEAVQPYDNEIRAQGMIEPAMGAQEGFNAVASKFLESYALAPPPTIQGTPQQIEPFKPWYQARTSRILPYLPWVPHQVGGTVLPPPNMLDTNIGPTIQALTMGLQMFSEAVSTTTGIDSQLAHLGATDPSLKSGKAIQALQAQSIQGTSGPLHNLKMSVSYEGHIINNLLYPIYGKKPGRLVRMMNGQGETERVKMAPPADPNAPAPMPAAGQKLPLQYRLTPDAKFNVIIKIAPKVTARRQQEADRLGEIIGAQPQMMGVFGDLYFKYQDGPGSQEMSERARAMLAPQVQQMLTAKAGGANIPPDVQMQMQKMGQQIQRLEGIAHGAAQELKSKRAEQQTKIEIEHISAKKELALQQMKDATSIAVAQINALTKGVQMDTEKQNEALALAHDATQAEFDREHDARMGLLGNAHDAALAQTAGDQAAASQASDQAHAVDLADQGHQQALAQAQQAADLAPPPAEAGA